jgi:hypothetical protein
MSKNRGKSKLSNNVLFNANKHIFHCEKSLGTLFYGQLRTYRRDEVCRRRVCVVTRVSPTSSVSWRRCTGAHDDEHNDGGDKFTVIISVWSSSRVCVCVCRFRSRRRACVGIVYTWSRRHTLIRRRRRRHKWTTTNTMTTCRQSVDVIVEAQTLDGDDTHTRRRSVWVSSTSSPSLSRLSSIPPSCLRACLYSRLRRCPHIHTQRWRRGHTRRHVDVVMSTSIHKHDVDDEDTTSPCLYVSFTHTPRRGRHKDPTTTSTTRHRKCVFVTSTY